MITDCEMLGHPIIDGDECPCGEVAVARAEPEPPVTFHHQIGVWWAGIPRLNFGAPQQTCEHPPIRSLA